jgi:hypothetical protein
LAVNKARSFHSQRPRIKPGVTAIANPVERSGTTHRLSTRRGQNGELSLPRVQHRSTVAHRLFIWASA